MLLRDTGKHSSNCDSHTQTSYDLNLDGPGFYVQNEMYEMYKAKRTGLPALLGLFSVSKHLLILHSWKRGYKCSTLLRLLYHLQPPLGDLSAPHWIESLHEGRPARQILSPRAYSSQHTVWADTRHTLAEGGKEQTSATRHHC